MDLEQTVSADAAYGPQVSVIVCTRNRPSELELCLASLEMSSVPVSQVIVSDDSDDVESRDVVERFGDLATWTAGPRRGLGPNRNHALTLVTGTHVLFLDDDATLGVEFLAACARRLDAVGADATSTIVSGVERRPDGHRVVAHEQDFLGYQRRVYRPGEPVKTVVINSALFPSGLFARVSFDEQLVYGYDEVDLTSRAVRLGYSILCAEDAVNFHDPSAVNRDYYRPRVDAARIYVTAKRRLVTERAPLRAAAFLAIAIPHLFLNALSGRSRVPRAQVARITIEALGMLRRSVRQPQT